MRISKLDFAQSTNLNDALAATITVSSLIIGFIGAILPVIMSMKNDSKIVKYVFEKDTDRLFLKYIKQTLLTGIVAIIVTVTVYFRDLYTENLYFQWCVCVTGYALSCFLLCTYRCLNNMLNIIFSNDNVINNGRSSFEEKSEREKKFEKEITIIQEGNSKV